MAVEISAEQRGLHQRLANGLQEMGNKKVAAYLEKSGIMDRIREQISLIDQGQGIKASEYFKQREARRASASASR